MPNPNLTEIIGVVDRSGSMGSVIEEARSGLNSFIDEQKQAEGDARLSLTFFDDVFDRFLDGVPIQDVEKITPEDYYPRGWTALLDAVGKTIDEVGLRLSNTPEDQRPGNVVFFILTDGAENSSKEYTGKGQVKAMIERQEKDYNWQFVFLGCNQDAIREAQNLGIQQDLAATYAAGAQGTGSAFAAASKGIASYRATGDRAMFSCTLQANVLHDDARQKSPKTSAHRHSFGGPQKKSHVTSSTSDKS